VGVGNKRIDRDCLRLRFLVKEKCNFCGVSRPPGGFFLKKKKKSYGMLFVAGF
jgi:hypothetical protein